MMYLSQDNTLSFDEQQLWASRVGILQDNWYTTRTELPKNPQGRVLKYLLRDEGKTMSTWDLEETTIQVNKQ